MKCKDEQQFIRSMMAHAMYLLKHDYPCSSAASTFEYKMLSFLETFDDPELLKMTVEGISRMSDHCVATFVTDRFKKVLEREIVPVEVCEICKDNEAYQQLRKEFDDVMPA